MITEQPILLYRERGRKGEREGEEEEERGKISFCSFQAFKKRFVTKTIRKCLLLKVVFSIVYVVLLF